MSTDLELAAWKKVLLFVLPPALIVAIIVWRAVRKAIYPGGTPLRKRKRS